MSRSKFQMWKETVHEIESVMAALSAAASDLDAVHQMFVDDYEHLAEAHLGSVHGDRLRDLAALDLSVVTDAVENLAEFTALAAALPKPSLDFSHPDPDRDFDAKREAARALGARRLHPPKPPTRHEFDPANPEQFEPFESSPPTASIFEDEPTNAK